MSNDGMLLTWELRMMNILCTFNNLPFHRAAHLGSDACTPVLWVVMVSMVSTPSDILAGMASTLIQNETQDRITTSALGTYVWIM